VWTSVRKRGSMSLDRSFLTAALNHFGAFSAGSKGEDGGAVLVVGVLAPLRLRLDNAGSSLSPSRPLLPRE